MFCTRKKIRSNRRLFSPLDDFDQDGIFGNAMSNRQEKTLFNEGRADQELTVGNSAGGPAVNENVVGVITSERSYNKKIGGGMCNIVDTVEDGIQKAILTAIDSIITIKIKLALRSMNASSGRDATSVMASWKRRQNKRLLPFSKTYPKRTIRYICQRQKAWWDSKQKSGRSKWIVGPRFLIRPATTYSLHHQWRHTPISRRPTQTGGWADSDASWEIMRSIC